jgi:segregation and condensation protein B
MTDELDIQEPETDGETSESREEIESDDSAPEEVVSEVELEPQPDTEAPGAEETPEVPASENESEEVELEPQPDTEVSVDEETPAVPVPENEDEEVELMDEAEPVEMLTREETRQALYAMLFASDRPLGIARLAEALNDVDKDIVFNLIEELKEEIATSNVPYILKEIAGGYQLMSKPEYAPFIRRLFQIKKSKRLSKAVLETLAIIAYKQPVTRADVESVRGVSVSHAFELLLEKRLIKVSGIAEAPGRPKLYRTTDEFLMHFGLGSLKEMPSLEELREVP